LSRKKTKLKTFIEIGCADFDTLVPLAAKGGWSGWCVEPIPEHAATLREASRGLPVGIVEAAISSFDGHVTMAVGGGQDWARGASHVMDSHHSGAKMLEHPDNVALGLKIAEIEVQSIKLDTFLLEHDITEVDFMKIDVEGHEMEILNHYSWDVKPKIIKCEHKHLSGNTLDKMLKRQGYSLFVETDDIYAIL
jgi:FkbM family methyltransferase